MARQNRLKSGADAAIVVVATLAIAVMVNMLSGEVFGRLDLTENDVNSLSDASKQAVRDLDELEVSVFISPDLPETIRDQSTGQEVDLRSVEQKLRDTIEEYRSFSEGHMRVTYVTDDVVERAETAKLQLFAGDEATADKAGRLEFKKYALGVTFNYGDVMETLPLALYPSFYEFEITKRLLRLKDKSDKAALMKDVLAAGERVHKAVAACSEALAKVEPKEDAPTNPFGLLSAEQSKAQLDAFKNGIGAFKPTCDEVRAALTSSAQLKKKSYALDNVLVTAEAFDKSLTEALASLASEDPQVQGKALQLMQQVKALTGAVEAEHDTLVDSPGRRAIGFVCAGGTFCPFPSTKPLVPQELKGVLGQKNPFVGQVIAQLEQMSQEINQNLVGIQRNLFERRGFNIVRVDLAEPVPSQVQSLVVFGATKSFTDWQLYQLDQFLLGGGSVVAFVNGWDVSLMNLSASGEMDVTALKPNTSNIADFLGHFGIRPKGDLVLEPKSHDNISLLAVIRQGQLAWRTQKMFPYPMLPALSEFDADNPLVRSISTLTLPFASSLEVSPEVTALVKTSAEAVTTTDPSFPLLPDAQLERIAGQAGDGPHVVAAVAVGEFGSYFAGKPKPAAPKKEGEEEQDPAKKAQEEAAERAKGQRLERGTGRLLVIGSNMGLEDLSAETIFDGFTVAKLSDNALQHIDEFRSYGARYQNWQVRLRQIQHLIFDNLQFVFNALDWSIQQDALVELRSKQYVRRPLEQTDDDERTAIRFYGIAGGPLVVLLLGLLHWFYQRKRRQRIALVAGSKAPIGVKAKPGSDADKTQKA